MQMQALLKHPSVHAKAWRHAWADVETTLSTCGPRSHRSMGTCTAGKALLKSIAPRLWPQFLHALDASAKVVDCPPVAATGDLASQPSASNVACKADIPAVRHSQAHSRPHRGPRLVCHCFCLPEKRRVVCSVWFRGACLACPAADCSKQSVPRPASRAAGKNPGGHPRASAAGTARSLRSVLAAVWEGCRRQLVCFCA